MNQDILKGKWKEMKGEVKRQWGKLTDDDVNRIDGSLEKLEGQLMQRYGYSKEEAHRQAETWLGRSK